MQRWLHESQLRLLVWVSMHTPLHFVCPAGQAPVQAPFEQVRPRRAADVAAGRDARWALAVTGEAARSARAGLSATAAILRRMKPSRAARTDFCRTIAIAIPSVSALYDDIRRRPCRCRVALVFVACCRDIFNTISW